MPKKIRRIGKDQTLLFVIEEPTDVDKSDVILSKKWEAPVSKRSYRLGSLADKIMKGLWFACPNCDVEDIEFVSDASQAWLSNKAQFMCPVCGEEVSLE